jgi:hypothetical protein
MSTFVVFFGILLVSLVVSFLAALQLADFFQATEEFAAVAMALVIIAAVSVLALGLVYAAARRVGALAVVALVLCLALLGLVALPTIIDIRAGRAGVADSFRGSNLAVSLEVLVAGIAAILTQWGLAQHRWLRLRGQENLSLWPWITTVIAGLVILSPPGLEIVAGAIRQSVTDWFRQLWTAITLGGTALFAAMALIEYIVRRRMLRRRQHAV